MAYGAVSAAPWVPLPQRDVRRLISICQPRPGEVLYDLGCGDGRVVAVAGRDFALRSVGFEVAVVPYLLAKARLWLAGLNNAQIWLKNFWQADLSQADIVVCFLTPAAMIKLLPKLQRELKPGARFATYAFPLPLLTPTEINKPLHSDAKIYLYTNIVRGVN